mgnify:CR=1 FL=1
MTLNYKIANKPDFSQEEIKANLGTGGLLSLELEFSRECNLRCIYCYANANEKRKNELGFSEIKNLVDQASDLGAKKIILLGGGEPLLYERLPQVIEYISKKGLEQSIFTNGTLLTDNLSRFLYDNEVFVVIKQNSWTPDVQDKLTGIEGSYHMIQKGLEILLNAGYPGERNLLGIETIICRQNINEIPGMWIWARERNIIPYFEILTLQGRAKKHPELAVSIDETKVLFEELKDLDIKRFGLNWQPHPTIASFSCKRHLYSCLVNSQGYVQPCTGVDKFVGNIREKSLKDILIESPSIESLRNIFNTIEGVCAECKYLFDCYGCRGNAYQITGNFLASDPSCWLNNGKKKQQKLEKS